MKRLTSIFAAILFTFSAMPIFAQSEGAPAKEQNLSQVIVMIALALIFFYFILWRPEQKRRKKMQAQRESMKVGDKVTAMGIVGTVAKIQETTLILKMVDGSQIEVLKNAITDVQNNQTQK